MYTISRIHEEKELLKNHLFTTNSKGLDIGTFFFCENLHMEGDAIWT